MVVVSSGQLEAEALEIRNRLIDKGVPSFPDFERAAGALKRVTEYYKSQRDGD
jgi:acyl-CoA synthetase (NDP forming)